jgi:hypothetical protein
LHAREAPRQIAGLVAGDDDHGHREGSRGRHEGDTNDH